MSETLYELNPAFRFASRPFPMPARLRPSWGIGTLVLLVSGSRQGATSQSRLQVLYWAIRTDENTKHLGDFLDGRIPLVDVAIRYDPSFDFALLLALADNLLHSSGTRVSIEAKGRDLASLISSDAAVLAKEKRRAAGLGKRLTERTVSQLLGGGGNR